MQQPTGNTDRPTITEVIEAIDLRVGDVVHLDWSSTPRTVSLVDYLGGFAVGYEFADGARRGTFANDERIKIERQDVCIRPTISGQPCTRHYDHTGECEPGAAAAIVADMRARQAVQS